MLVAVVVAAVADVDVGFAAVAAVVAALVNFPPPYIVCKEPLCIQVLHKLSPV